MGKQYTARLFRTGGSRAVRIPAELLPPGDEVVITKEGDAIVIRAATDRCPTMGDLLADLPAWGPAEDDPWADLPDPLPEARDPLA